VKQKRTKDNPIKLRMLSFYTESKGDHTWLCIRLPSGRPLRYYSPRIQKRERFGKMVDQLTYRSEFKGKLIRETTYGGKLVENITQAVARDVMVESMWRAEKRGYISIGTVHDELIAEVPEDFGSAHELEEIMRIRPKWASDAPINAEGWQGPRYRK
jgi:DNA polymerase